MSSKEPLKLHTWEAVFTTHTLQHVLHNTHFTTLLCILYTIHTCSKEWAAQNLLEPQTWEAVFTTHTLLLYYIWFTPCTPVVKYQLLLRICWNLKLERPSLQYTLYNTYFTTCILQHLPCYVHFKTRTLQHTLYTTYFTTCILQYAHLL